MAANAAAAYNLQEGSDAEKSSTVQSDECVRWPKGSRFVKPIVPSHLAELPAQLAVYAIFEIASVGHLLLGAVQPDPGCATCLTHRFRW